MEVSGESRENDLPSLTIQDPIASYPTADIPLSDTLLKEMLLSLREALHTDMSALVKQCRHEVQHVGQRVDHIENTMSAYSQSFNQLLDSHTAQNEEITRLQDKLSDLEDRSRRSNIKIRGIPEDIAPTQLLQYAQTLFSTILPNLTHQDLIIDRIHRLPKPSFIREDTPRDVLLKMHYDHVKEQIMIAARKPDAIRPPYANLILLPDLSRHTLQRRRNLATITKALRNHKVLHKWRHPATLIITHHNSTVQVTTMEEGLSFLKKWGIIPEQAAQQQHPSASQPSPLGEEWAVVTHKRNQGKNKTMGSNTTLQ